MFILSDVRQRFVSTVAQRDYDHEIITEQRSKHQIDAIDWNLLSKYEVDSTEYPYLSAVEKLPAMQYYEAPVCTSYYSCIFNPIVKTSSLLLYSQYKS
jgi:hypothetical protein